MTTEMMIWMRRIMTRSMIITLSLNNSNKTTNNNLTSTSNNISNKKRATQFLKLMLMKMVKSRLSMTPFLARVVPSILTCTQEMICLKDLHLLHINKLCSTLPRKLLKLVQQIRLIQVILLITRKTIKLNSLLLESSKQLRNNKLRVLPQGEPTRHLSLLNSKSLVDQ